MSAPAEPKYSDNESDDGNDDSYRKMVPATLDASVRQQFLREMIKVLPQQVQNRITALKNMQLEQLYLETEFYAEVDKLERAFQNKYQTLFDKRRDILTGEVEPKTEKPKWNVHDDDNADEDEVNKKDFSGMLWEIKQMPENAKGIPHFWLAVFQNVELISQFIETHDEPILQSLSDVTIKYDAEHSFTLEFHFENNEYFSNKVLTKQYFLVDKPDPDYPFDYDGPTINKCKGCHIDWQPNRNATIKTTKKKVKKHGVLRTVTRTVRKDSFFHFFNPPEVPADVNEADAPDEDIKETLDLDYEVGDFLRTKLIPRAILYYTGDIVEEDDSDEEDEEEEEEEELGGDSEDEIYKNKY